MIPALIGIILAFMITSTAIVRITMDNFFIVGNTSKSQQAFNIAESGLNYYLWHLNHNNTDYRDGQSTPTTPDPSLGYGPYTHSYVNSDGVVAGTYTLYIKPVSANSTIVNVRSIGQAKDSKIKRTVQAQIGTPSFASYVVASDTALWFGATEAADGPVHSNQGVRMDGQNTSTVSAANTTYVPPANLGGNGSTSRPGVWCDSSVTTPVNCNTRPKGDWLYPVSSIDFNQVSGSLCTMKKAAFADNSATASLATQTNACSQVPNTRTSGYLPQRSATYNLTKGYMVQLNTNGTYDLYNVNSEDDKQTSYSSALGTSPIASNISIPSSGVIYAEDNVWVRTNPTFHGRVTIAAGRLTSNSASTYANVVIADDMRYTTKNGADVIGLVSQNDIILAPYAPPASGTFNFEVDAATLAQTGEVWYPGYYRTDTDYCTRGWVNSDQKFLFYGSVATRQTWTWTWLWNRACGDNVYKAGTGYISGVLNNTTQYDYNLLYSPPPQFPITNGYNFISWREVLTRP